MQGKLLRELQDFITFMLRIMKYMNARPKEFSEKDNRKPLVGDNVEIEVLG